jgi:hypothetical protein
MGYWLRCPTDREVNSEWPRVPVLVGKTGEARELSPLDLKLEAQASPVDEIVLGKSGHRGRAHGCAPGQNIAT